MEALKISCSGINSNCGRLHLAFLKFSPPSLWSRFSCWYWFPEEETEAQWRHLHRALWLENSSLSPEFICFGFLFYLLAVWHKHFSFFRAVPPDLSRPHTHRQRDMAVGFQMPGPGPYPAALWASQYLPPFTGHLLGRSSEKIFILVRLPVILQREVDSPFLCVWKAMTKWCALKLVHGEQNEHSQPFG